MNNMQGSCGINKSQVKYIDLDQSRYKDIYLIKVKKESSMFIQDYEHL